jgi:hypothetical protein
MTTEDFAPVLQQLAAREGINVTDLYIAGDVVFQIGTPYWCAAKAAAEVLARLQGR